MFASSAYAFGPSSIPDFHDDIPAIQELARKQRISLKPPVDSTFTEDPVTRVQELSQEITLIHQDATRVLRLFQPVNHGFMIWLMTKYRKLQRERWGIIQRQILGPLATESRGARPGFLRYFAQVAVYCDLQHLYYNFGKRLALLDTWMLYSKFDLQPMPSISPSISPQEALHNFNYVRIAVEINEGWFQQIKSRVETNLVNLINDKRYPPLEECVEYNKRMSCFAKHASDIATSSSTQFQANQTPIQSAWTVSSWFPLSDGAEETDESEREVVSQSRMVKVMDDVSFEIGKNMGIIIS